MFSSTLVHPIRVIDGSYAGDKKTLTHDEELLLVDDDGLLQLLSDPLSPTAPRAKRATACSLGPRRIGYRVRDLLSWLEDNVCEV